MLISLPSIPLRLVTELVTVALHCPRMPAHLVTHLVTVCTALIFSSHGLFSTRATGRLLPEVLSSFANLAFVNNPMPVKRRVGFVAEDAEDRCSRRSASMNCSGIASRDNC